MKLYFAVDKDGTKWFYEEKPIRDNECGQWFGGVNTLFNATDLDIDEINNLTWEDEPLRVRIERVEIMDCRIIYEEE